ncbi:hypothetical protein E4U31_007846 [Claviceps sp. LM219 group G6]|nr:hypothetical protein E4U15_006373 [Claviceps sp. LM218 group G6]KAG6108239.1 hypothetical protein E4U31_007846 [Claviceps sp. LM219 group G6]
MVSHQPSSASATAASRRREQCPPSRAERYSRFSADASSNEFPIFTHTGDVEITIRGAVAADGVEAVSNTYLLHQHILARCSGFFAASTSSQWSKAQSDPANGGAGGDKDSSGCAQNTLGSTRPTRRWKYELHHGSAWSDVPILVQKDPFPAQKGVLGRAGGSQSSSPSPSGPGSGGPVTSQPENGSQRVFDAEPDMREWLFRKDKILLRNYDNLFRIFYHYRPMLENVDTSVAYAQCEYLLKLADQYDALAVVSPCVEYHLLQSQSKLWKHVARIPDSYLALSYQIRSKVIFKEALINVVGDWFLSQKRPHLDVPNFVFDIAENKVHELQETVNRVEGQLFRLSLTTARGERVSPANDYMGWLAICLFRQWLADNTKAQPEPACNNETVSDNDHHSEVERLVVPPTFYICRVYRILGSDNPSAFLDHKDCEAFLALNPQLYTPENLDRFEKRMADLKALARELVGPLLRNSLELDVTKYNGPSEIFKPLYFTCTTIEDDDIPWPLEPYIPPF